MKKIYTTPDIDLTLVLTRDVITISVGLASVDEEWGNDNQDGERVQTWKF